MPTVVQQARADLRDKFRKLTQVNPHRQRMVNLGMHYIPAPDGTPVLVTIEINVSRLLATIGPKVCRNKCGMSAGCRGSVRVSLATAEAIEICAACMVKPAPVC